MDYFTTQSAGPVAGSVPNVTSVMLARPIGRNPARVLLLDRTLGSACFPIPDADVDGWTLLDALLAAWSSVERTKLLPHTDDRVTALWTRGLLLTGRCPDFDSVESPAVVATANYLLNLLAQVEDDGHAPEFIII